MKSDAATHDMPGFWPTVGILLRAARKRAMGRQKRQRELLQQRTGRKAAIGWGNFGFVLALFLMAGLHVAAAFVVYTAVTASERIAAERGGKIVVDNWFSEAVLSTLEWNARGEHKWDAALDRDYGIEARILSREHGGEEAAMEQRLRRAVQAHGTGDFLSERQAVAGFTALPQAGPLAGLLGSIVLFWWIVMLVFQGEGLDLDLQRRRHPMWEWLFSHPVPMGAVFLAEMLSPIAANPVYLSAPLFPGFLYGFIYGPGLGCLAGFLVGVPLMLAAASLGKALEIGVILRFAPRTRGAMVGIMSWIGYASLMLFFISIATMSKAVYSIAAWLQPLAVFPAPWLGLFLGETWNGAFSFPWGIAVGWFISALTIGVSVWISVWGAQEGLSGNFGRADSVATPAASGATRFTKDPLYRKELLWFRRDRSAIVQTILVPLTVAGFQLFNMRGLVSQAQGAWNLLCGGGILFGTYFLWVLGPKSLASEGNALWIALTWPRGLESLLKAKARLWSVISSGVVGLVLIYAAVLYPANIVNITLVGVGWYFFGGSMAEKAVTLVTVTSESGETQKIPTGRRWAAQLGMLTFSIGILTQQWHIAIMGIVYSYLTAAAMWENFRARLPFLYDPWSEKSPPPPTLMNAMISISILVESGAVLTGIALVAAGAFQYRGPADCDLRALRHHCVAQRLEISQQSRRDVERHLAMAASGRRPDDDKALVVRSGRVRGVLLPRHRGRSGRRPGARRFWTCLPHPPGPHSLHGGINTKIAGANGQPARPAPVLHGHGDRVCPMGGRVPVSRTAFPRARSRMGRLARHRRERRILRDLSSRALMAARRLARNRKRNHLQAHRPARPRRHPPYGLQYGRAELTSHVSKRAALRILSRRCPRRESNPHGDFSPQDFKSCMSAIPSLGRR